MSSGIGSYEGCRTISVTANIKDWLRARKFSGIVEDAKIALRPPASVER